MSDELTALKTVAEALNGAEIPYMLTGSIAHNYYSVPRMTRDIDIVVELNEEDIEKFMRLFSTDFYVEQEMVIREIKRKGMFNIIHTALLVKIDFIVRKENAYRKEEFSRRRKITIDGVDMYIVSPEDLILSKLFWAKDSRSELQRRDVKNLLEDVKDIDKGYIDKWKDALGVAELLEEM